MARVHRKLIRRPRTAGGRLLLFLFLLLSIPVAGKAASPSLKETFTLSWRWRAETLELVIQGPEDLEVRLPRGSFLPKVVVDVAAAPDPGVPHSIFLGDVAFQRIRVQDGPLGGQIVVDLEYPLPPPQVSRTEEGIVVAVTKRFRTVDETYVAPGVWFGQARVGEVWGPVTVKYLKVATAHPHVRVYPVLAGDVFGLAKVSDVVARRGALAAVNGGYYHWSGRPLGLLIVDGQLISQDIYGRTALGFREDGTLFISPLSVEMWLETDLGRIPLDGINRPRARGEAVVYTSHYGALPRPTGTRFAILYGTVLRDPGWQEVPAGALVIEFDEGDTRFGDLKAGQRASFAYQVAPGQEGSVRFAIGGGPRLLAGGEICVTGERERFQPDVVSGRAPRTAAGLDEDGFLYLVVADGRGAGGSSGMTLEELASFLKELGLKEALNLDGGGSSTLALRGRVFNHPSVGEERAVATALVVDVGAGGQ